MIITIKYFGLIAEVTSQEEETIDFSGNTIADIINFLNSKYPDLKNKDFQVAQNQELISEKTKITGQEIALLPPFSGG
ncbi:MoaD/ThiS family protein [Confluentibacter lentus]|uniref:MoaD/ThiS family protein n=1 Tax=Confluentibacter lentus TaxID=1699412 RepID=UPI000C283DD3|nr:MoaD/ThiS family protein [Confluentibacter lentus]